LHNGYASCNTQQIGVSRKLQQGATTGFRRAIDLTGTQAGAGFVKKVLRLNLG
jgi:hypothetical protein